MVVAAVIARWGKRFGICDKVLEELLVVEAIVVRRLKWLVAVVTFVVKRSGIGCCGDFWDAM